MLGSPHGVFAEVPLCGDIGAIVEPHKHVYVTGRVKELIITAGGENVSPGVAEALVLDLLPFVSQCVVLGDRRPFVAALLTLKEERVAQSSADSDSPVFELPSQLIDLLRARGSAVTTAAEATVAQDEALWEIIQAGLDKVNKKLASRAAHVRRFAILPTELSAANGELTATQKYRRAAINRRHKNVIDAIYDAEARPTEGVPVPPDAPRGESRM
eukprot:Selendium_serpulae@DN5359_c0_g1_i5.p4